MTQQAILKNNSAVLRSPCIAEAESAAPAIATAGAALDARGYAHGNRPDTWLKPGMVRRLVELHATLMPFAEIAVKLTAEFNVEVSRSAVIGRARRMHLPQRQFIPLPKKEQVPKAIPVCKPVRKVKLKPVNGLRQRKNAKSLDLSLFDLRPGQCRWPYGDRAPFKFCGHQTQGTISWCPEHFRMVYVRSQQRDHA